MEAVTERLAELLDLLSARDEIQRALLTPRPASEVLERAAALFSALDFAPGEHLLRESAEDVDLVLLLVAGQAEASARPTTVDGRPGEPQVVGHLAALDVVGEIGLVMRTRRSATVTASCTVRALAISRDALAALGGVHAPLAAALVRWCAQNAAEKMLRSARRDDQDLPMGVPVKGENAEVAPIPDALLAPDFAWADAERNYAPSGTRTAAKTRARLQELRGFDWDAAEITAEVAGLFRFLSVPARRAIVSEGEPGESVLILSRGIANIRRPDGELVHGWVAGHIRPVHALVGELAFLEPRARTGTVVAATTCELLELPVSAVPELVALAPRLAQLLHLAILRAVCPKLAETSAARATLGAIAQGDWEQWFVDDDYYTRKLKALDM